MPPPTPIRSTREQLTERIREDVVSGRLAVGARVSEAELSERFGVSRGPIREALSQMITEGLFVAKPNCGVVVAPSAPAEIRELILPVRATIETYALRQVLRDLTEDDFACWDEVLRKMRTACRQEAVGSFVALDVALHHRIVERCGLPDLLAIWQMVVSRMRAHFTLRAEAARSRGELLSLYEDHLRLIQTFRGRSERAAVKTLKDHIHVN